MSDIKFYRFKQTDNASTEKIASELVSTEANLERTLQNLVEANMESFFGVRLLRSEYVIKDGRMDSIGIDENYSPVIFEYKCHKDENVINQGLFYLDWLLDHKGDFQILVQQEWEPEAVEKIDFSAPTVFCIAKEFNKYDLHAVNRMGVNIRLVKYHFYEDDLICFEHLNSPSVTGNSGCSDSRVSHKKAKNKEALTETYEELCAFIESLGDDISRTQLKYYLAYKKVRNFVCIERTSSGIKLYLPLDPKKYIKPQDPIPGFAMRDVSATGHHGTGDLEVVIGSLDALERVKPLIEQAYNEV